MSKPTNFTNEQTLELLVHEIQASVPANAVISVDGVPMTQPELLKEARAELTFFTTAQAAKDASKKATADLRAARPRIRRFLKVMKISLKSYLGADNPDIEKFGFHLDKKAETSTEKKALAAEKARRTREARHTMGKRQKAAIHGEVDEVVIPNPDAPQKQPKKTP